MAKSPLSESLTDEEKRRLENAKSVLSVSPLAAWGHATADIPASGVHRARQASEEERAAISKALGLKALDTLAADYRITSVPGGGWRLKGTLSADLVQSCVVTLEPVPAAVSETFDVEFWRDLGEPEGGEDKSVLEGPDVESLTGDTLDVGRIVFEAFSAAIDPYPRAPGAALDWRDPKAKNPQKSNPFSVLGRLKDKD